MTSKSRDIVAALFVIGLAIFIQFFSRDIEISKFTNLGADFFPKLISTILGTLGMLLLILTVFKTKKDDRSRTSPKTDSKETPNTGNQKGGFISRNSDWFSILLIIIYAFSLKFTGFVISTMAYLFLQMIILSVKEKRSLLSFGLIAIVAPILIYLIFTEAFSLMLPQGILG